jgi:predicted HD phosphohydrolase
MTLEPLATVDAVLAALASVDGEPSDDVVPPLPHLLQTAERLADRADDDPELVAAGLVHDLASALELGIRRHEVAGAALVEPVLGARVARLVAGHTEAKRYLVTVDPRYAGGLSENSTFTLIGQGGPMTDDEVRAFEQDADAAALVALRRADDAAKVPGGTTRMLDAWRPLLERVARR